jgi:hypothetical protein
MTRDLVIPLLSKVWSSTKWEHAALHTWTFCEVEDTIRLGVWVDWADNWDEYYKNGWYLIEKTGDRISWSMLYEAELPSFAYVKEWVCALE